MSLPRSLSTPGVLTQLSGNGKVLRRPNRPGSLKISGGQGQASLNRLSSMSSMSSLEMSGLEDLVVTMENVARHLVNRNYSLVVLSALNGLYSSLHQCGMQLDTLYKDQLDKLMSVFRTASRDEELELVSRVQILHIIELRAAGWVTNDNMVNYYKQRLSHMENIENRMTRDSPQICHTAPISLNANAPDFNPGPGQCLLLPGEVVGSSGKFGQPTKIPGKNYFKDEVVIRNADSGKVMGLKGRRVHMIEQLTETVVSFQRVVPGARERLVQLTGPGYDNIVQAKLLIEETIRRNQSPIPRDEVMPSPQEISSSLDTADSRRNTLIAPDREGASIDEYKYTVNVGEECIRITGASLDLVRTAKLVLEEYFSLGDTVNDMNKVLLKDSRPSRTSFQVGPPAPPPVQPPEAGQARLNTLSTGHREHRSAFESIDRSKVVPASCEDEGTVPLKMPKVSYNREELLSFAAGCQNILKNSPKLEDVLSGLPAIRRRDNLVFDGQAHLEKGRGVFNVPDYVRSYNVMDTEYD